MSKKYSGIYVDLNSLENLDLRTDKIKNEFGRTSDHPCPRPSNEQMLKKEEKRKIKQFNSRANPSMAGKGCIFPTAGENKKLKILSKKEY